MLKGQIVKSTGSWYHVQTEEGLLECRIQGKFRIQGLKLTNPVAVGDWVSVRQESTDETASIVKIHDRKNYIVRQSPRKKHFQHLLACNIDQAFLVTTIKAPMIKLGFIDRFLLTTAPFDIPTTIIINKADLYDEGEREMFGGLKFIYEQMGYQVRLVSSHTGEGIEELKESLKNKLTLTAGHSGVGKSTLLNAIQPDLDLKTNDISDYSGKGQHTTTFAEIFELSNGGRIIDTPGVKNMAFINMEPIEIAHYFKDIFQYSHDCKFSDCLHRTEPNCAVIKAVEEGNIAGFRYENYIQLLEEVEDQNYWERHKDLK